MKCNLVVTGYVVDEIIHLNPDGSVRNVEIREDHNFIMRESAPKLLAALMYNPAGASNLYWAVGSGNPEWDEYVPDYEERTTLYAEVHRTKVTPNDLVFLDNEGNVSPVPTNRIRIYQTIADNELNGMTLREHGIFGYNATDQANTGIMFNWKTHTRIDKDETMRIRRSVTFTFSVYGESGGD